MAACGWSRDYDKSRRLCIKNNFEAYLRHHHKEPKLHDAYYHSLKDIQRENERRLGVLLAIAIGVGAAAALFYWLSA